MIPLIMSVLYVWAQLNRDMIVSFWFGTRFKACYLPWVILGFNYIIGGSVINELIGNLVGHLYFFLMFKYPMDLGGRNFLSTPQFLYRWLPNRRGGVSGFGIPPASMRRAAEDQQGGGRHNWGQGFRLGDQWKNSCPWEAATLWFYLLVGSILVQSLLKNWALCSAVGFYCFGTIFLVREKIKKKVQKGKRSSYSRLASSVRLDSAIKNKLPLYSVVCLSQQASIFAILFCAVMEKSTDVLSHLLKALLVKNPVYDRWIKLTLVFRKLICFFFP